MSACCLFLVLLAGPGAPAPAAEGPRPAGVLEEARRARAAGDAREARRLYEEALSRDPRNPVLALEFAEALLDAGDPAAAGRILAVLVAAEPDRAGPRRAFARSLLALGKADEALVHARRAARLDPKNLDGTTLLGFALVAANQSGEAVASFRKVVAARPGDRDAHGGLAMAYAALSDPRADREFGTVLAGAGEPRYYWQYAEYLWRTHDADGGNRQMEKALGAAPGDPRLLAAYGMALYEQGRVHHVGSFSTLEDEMCDFDPVTTVKSPNRMDALVWALTELSDMTGTGMIDFYATLAAKQAAERAAAQH